MDVAEITAKARVLLEALPYIQDFRGSTFVVKYGGSFMDDPSPEVRNRVAYANATKQLSEINAQAKRIVASTKLDGEAKRERFRVAAQRLLGLGDAIQQPLFQVDQPHTGQGQGEGQHY